MGLYNLRYSCPDEIGRPAYGHLSAKDCSVSLQAHANERGIKKEQVCRGIVSDKIHSIAGNGGYLEERFEDLSSAVLLIPCLQSLMAGPSVPDRIPDGLLYVGRTGLSRLYVLWQEIAEELH